MTLLHQYTQTVARNQGLYSADKKIGSFENCDCRLECGGAHLGYQHCEGRGRTMVQI